MKKSFVVLTYVLVAAALSGGLSGCVVAPAAPGYYGYSGDYYAPGYYGYPAYAEPSIGIGFGFGGGDGWHHDHDRDWHGGRGGRGGRGGWRDGH